MITSLSAVGTTLLVCAALYAVLALCGRGPARRSIAPGTVLPGVSVLKPLCGPEPRLYENLCALCVQTHPLYQIVCGVRDPNDPALAIVERVRATFPERDLDIVINPSVHGSNLKVSNLMNLLGSARHEVLVIADSDIGVPPDYLERVVAPLTDASVGLVTCPYRGVAVAGFWSRVGAQFINTWFWPSVRLARTFGARTFGFGATLALRRTTLEALGGFGVLRNRLADDYWLAQLVRQQGLDTLLSEVCVTTDIAEPSLAELWTRELRWLRTIRSLNPVGFFFTFVSYTVPLVVVGVALAPTPANLTLAAVALAARVGLNWQRPGPGLPRPGDVFFAPVRDLLLLCGWTWALLGREVEWRKQIVSLRDGSADPYP
jgi:ceramide glucosyltransferase